MQPDVENPLAGLGYTPREAAFLRMVAMHSGVFQRRHFVEFTGTGDGKAAQTLIAKLVARHGKALAFGENRFLYRLSHQAVYRALGIEDSNHRKSRSPTLMKARLMALDLVLAHADALFLETEDEKIRFFTTQLGIASNDLPHVDYPSRRGATEPCRHWFVEKYPIFLSGQQTQPLVNFSFVDDGQATTSGFANFLRRYSAALAASRFRLHYVTESAAAAAAAQKHFERILNRARSESPPPGDQQLLRYFELMKRWRAGRTRFNSDQFAEIAKLRRLYNEPKYEAQFDTWLRGEALFLSRSAPVGREKSVPEVAGEFEPYIIGGRYGFLSVAVPAPVHLRTRRSPRGAPAASPANQEAPATEAAKPEGVSTPTEGGEKAALRKPPEQTHAGSDPVVTGFAPAGQSSAFPHSRNR